GDSRKTVTTVPGFRSDIDKSKRERSVRGQTPAAEILTQFACGAGHAEKEGRCAKRKANAENLYGQSAPGPGGVVAAVWCGCFFRAARGVRRQTAFGRGSWTNLSSPVVNLSTAPWRSAAQKILHCPRWPPPC